MKSIRELHKEAMDLAEMALVAKLRGDLTQANQLFRQAFEKESQAARQVPDEPSAEPTRSILYRSAATLALDCREWREAERLIAAGSRTSRRDSGRIERIVYHSTRSTASRLSGCQKGHTSRLKNTATNHHRSLIVRGRNHWSQEQHSAN